MSAEPDHEKRSFAACADAIAEVARDFAARGWTPATSSNFSMRLDAMRVAITASGRDKGRLSRDDIMLVNFDGAPLVSDSRPSAETALHVQMYRRDPSVRAVLHTHSRTQSVASRVYAQAGVIRLKGWELQKAVTGFDSHASTLEVPVFPNTQHMPELVASVDAWLDANKPLYAYLIDGHGMYTWGRSLLEARRHLEALEFLLTCELDLRRLNQ